MKMKFSKQELDAFRVYFAKGCVGLPTAEMASENARRLIEQYLSPDEVNKLGTAEDHAKIVGEGRREWDGVCKGIRERLGL